MKKKAACYEWVPSISEERAKKLHYQNQLEHWELDDLRNEIALRLCEAAANYKDKNDASPEHYMQSCGLRIVKKLIRDEIRKQAASAEVLPVSVTGDPLAPPRRHSHLNIRLKEIASHHSAFVAAWLFLGQLSDFDSYYNKRGMDNKVLNLIRNRLHTTLYDEGLIETAPKQRLLEKDVTEKEMLLTARALERTDFETTPRANYFHVMTCIRLSEQWLAMGKTSRQKILFHRLFINDNAITDQSSANVQKNIDNLQLYLRRRIRNGIACKFDRRLLKKLQEQVKEVSREDKDRELVIELTKIAVLMGVEPPPVKDDAFKANMLLFIEKQQSCNHLIALPFHPQKTLLELTRVIEKRVKQWSQTTDAIYQENKSIWKGKVQPTLKQLFMFIADGDTSSIPEHTLLTLQMKFNYDKLLKLQTMLKNSQRKKGKKQPVVKHGFRFPSYSAL